MPRIEPTIAAAKALAEKKSQLGWRTSLMIWLRLLSVAHLGWALWEWAALMGIVPPVGGEMTRAQLPRMGAAYFFAGIDPVAAVGLWLGSTWGTATWLVATFARIIIHTGYAGIFGWTTMWTGLQLASLLIYVLLFFLAERAEREAKKRSRRAA
jgi:hypothetical protein